MLHFDTSNFGMPRQELQSLKRKLSTYQTELSCISCAGEYTQPESSICLPSDADLLKRVRAVIAEFQCDLLVVVGIGGSNLGTMAVEQAIRGRSGLKAPLVLYADTIDERDMRMNLEIVRKYLSSGKRVVVNIVTKSGTTTESVANAACILAVLRQKGISLSKSVVVTTNQDSSLWKWAKKMGITTLEIPAAVGGRYSVFSAVGLFPLGLSGVNLQRLVRGARTMRNLCLKGRKNPALDGAAALYFHLQHGLVVHDLFCFSPDLEALGKWYRQLLAESTGKQGKGMLPTVSVGTNDLHSVAQLTLGGPRRSFTTFVSVRGTSGLRVPQVLNSLMPIGGYGLGEIRDAILAGTQVAYVRNKLPFMSIKLAAYDEESIGAFMQWKMIETMYFARLLNVNAFDQPSVEEYKEATRRSLVRCV